MRNQIGIIVAALEREGYRAGALGWDPRHAFGRIVADITKAEEAFTAAHPSHQHVETRRPERTDSAILTAEVTPENTLIQQLMRERDAADAERAEWARRAERAEKALAADTLDIVRTFHNEGAQPGESLARYVARNTETLRAALRTVLLPLTLLTHHRGQFRPEDGLLDRLAKLAKRPQS